MPTAATRPASINTTLSAIAMVPGRWAITIVVRPSITVSIAARISCSFDGSTALVASSSTSTLGSLTSALAIAIRWRWPPDSENPRSPSTVAYPSGRSSMKSAAPASSAARRTVSKSASGSAKAMLAATVSWNNRVSSNTNPTDRRTSCTRTVAEVDTVERDRTRLRVVEPHQQSGDGRFAGAGTADEGDRGARLDLEREPLESRVRPVRSRTSRRRTESNRPADAVRPDVSARCDRATGSTTCGVAPST